MDLDAFLADAAETVHGKLYALGIGWNTITVDTFPAILARVAIGMTLHVSYTETDEQHRLELRLEDADGARIALSGAQSMRSSETVMSIGAEFNVGRPEQLPAGDEQVICLAMTINSLLLERAEMYNWVIEVNGIEIKRLPMRVQRTQ